MKLAYRRLIKVKSSLSIAHILDKYKEAQAILSAPQYLSVESLVSSEELPIAMFLTSMKEEVNKYLGADSELHEIAKEELSNLFKLSCSPSKMQWLFDTHARLLGQARNSAIPVEVLGFCLDLKECLAVDESTLPVEGLIGGKRSSMSERELLNLLETQ